MVAVVESDGERAGRISDFEAVLWHFEAAKLNLIGSDLR